MTFDQGFASDLTGALPTSPAVGSIKLRLWLYQSLKVSENIYLTGMVPNVQSIQQTTSLIKSIVDEYVWHKNLQ